MSQPLQLLWVSCSESRSGTELLEECKRHCAVGRSSPNQVLQALAARRPDAVVFDFLNPVAAHLQLLQSVKRQYPSVPILMITESHSEELAVWAFRARVWNYLVKPVPLRELKGNLRQLAKVALHRAGSDSRRVERPGAILPALYAPPEPQSEEAVMQQVTEHIRRDHTSRLSITKLARGCGMSRFSFSRLFRKNFGVSCRDYVMRLRIETACTLLQVPGAAVSDVAATAGFTDASYFARMFRTHMGMSPKEYALQAATAVQQKPKQTT
jgi:YesN/AraC family two-component response regulator